MRGAKSCIRSGDRARGPWAGRPRRASPERPGFRRAGPRSAAALVLAGGGCVVALPGCGPGAPRADAPGGPRVVIDGEFDDWIDVAPSGPSSAPDPVGQRDGAPGAVGGPRVVATADGEAVYLLVSLGRVANPQGLDGALLIVFDADGDPATGPTAFDVPGVDLVLSFTRLRVGGPADHGVAAWEPDRDDPERVFVPAAPIRPFALGLRFEPRHSAERFEIRLARGRVRGTGVDAFVSDRWRGRVVELHADGTTASRAPLLQAALPPRDRSPPDRDETALARADGTDFRLVSWNVSRSRLMLDPDPARRILASLDPDVVLLDEVPPTAGAETLLDLLPTDTTQGPWSLHMGTSGGAQRGVVATRGAVAPAPGFGRVAYPDSALVIARAAGLAEVAGNVRAGGVPATGAWIVIDGRRVLAVTVDLVCCGNSADSPEDRIRRLEARAINGAARAALSGGGSPVASADSTLADGGSTAAVIVAGDFNLVGSSAPLELLAAGLAPDGVGDLVPVRALQLDGTGSATWVSTGEWFPPGQLDYVLTGGSLRVVGAFVFETDDMSPAALGMLGLTEDDSDRASDHRPIVVDLAWGR